MRTVEISLKLSATDEVGNSTIVVSIQPRMDVAHLVARLVLAAAGDRAVSCLPVNPFASLDAVADGVAKVGVQRLGRGFVLERPTVKSLEVLLGQLDAEAILMGLGGRAELEALARNASPPWWKLSRNATRPASSPLVMRFAPSHGSLEIEGGRGSILQVFDLARMFATTESQ